MAYGHNDSTDRRGVSLVSLQAESVGFLYRETSHSDGGVDGFLELRGEGGVSGRLLGVQVKAGSSNFREKVAGGFIFRFEKRHHDLWSNHTAPVIVALCDLEAETVYWENISAAEPVSAAKWKLLVPSCQTLRTSGAQLTDLAKPASDYKSIRILKEEDCSHCSLRRVSVHAEVLPGQKPLSQAMVREAAYSVFRRAQTSDYYRNDQTRQLFAGESADVVWGYIYDSASSLSQADWICRFDWCHGDVPEGQRPSLITSERDKHGVAFEWNQERFGKYVDSVRVSKGAFLEYADSLADQLKSLYQIGLRESDWVRLAEMSEALLTLQGAAPVECERLADALAAGEILARNIGLIIQSDAYTMASKEILLRGQHGELGGVVSRIAIYREDVR